MLSAVCSSAALLFGLAFVYAVWWWRQNREHGPLDFWGEPKNRRMW